MSEHDTALVLAPPTLPAIVITDDQLDLIKRTVAKDATEAELQLYFYDCKRRGVHPLDRLIHFTKRAGKYTPVTSIDFFRGRASATREHMGTEDATYVGVPGDKQFAATVVVYRWVQGEKVPFTATARFVEYVPDERNDFLWKKMPFNQIAKCAEALALRKGFPQELAGLHTFEEMEGAKGDDEPPKKVRRASETRPATGDSQTTAARTVADVVSEKDSQNRAYFVILLTGDTTRYRTRNHALASEVEKFKGTDHRIRLSYRAQVWNDTTYYNVENFSLDKAPPAPPLTAGDIPFESR